MRLVATEHAPDGATVARDVRASVTDAIPLLSAGATLQPAYRRALERASVGRLFIDDDLSAGIEPVAIVPPEVRANAIRAVSDVLAAASRATMRQDGLQGTHLDGLIPVAKGLALEVQRRPAQLPTLGETAPVGDYLPAHSVDVAILGLHIAARHQRNHGWIDHDTGARRYNLNDEALVKLGVALLLIDLGKVAMPRGLLEHPGPLDPPDRATITQHPELGASMLPPAVSYVVQAVLRHHHERFDGSGYPEGLAGQDIPFEARIAAIADVFDATTSNRAYSDAAPQNEGWSAIISGAGTAFDPELVEIFRQLIVPYPPASEVVLVDGRIAVVADVDPSDPLRPKVRAATLDGGVEELTQIPVQPVSGQHRDSGRAA
ncbi:MAG: HD domain-containing protein [Solirubrobacteraceae bacterium]|nr:HD domain-containing protein [Solirubrobacteraceae bacterium]